MNKLEEATSLALQGKLTEAEENSKWEKYLNKTIAVYDINDYIKKECGEQYQTFDYPGGAAIFTEGEGSGKCIIVDHEAVGITLNSENDEFKLGLNNIPKEEVDEEGNVHRSIPIFPEYAIKTTIKEILTNGKATPSTFEKFFDRRNYNSRCQENFNELMESLISLGILKDEEIKTEGINKEKVLNMTYEELPDMCYGLLPSDNSVIIIKKGETGYFPTDFGEIENAEEFVNNMNAKMGVTSEQRMVMELRSMHGNWDIKSEEKECVTEEEKSQFKFNFTDHDLYGSIANTDAMDTLEDLSTYFEGYASYLDSHRVEEQATNTEIEFYSEIGNEINDIREKLIKFWSDYYDGVMEESKETKEEFLDPNITIAPSTSLDLGDGAGLGMLASML